MVLVVAHIIDGRFNDTTDPLDPDIEGSSFFYVSESTDASTAELSGSILYTSYRCGVPFILSWPTTSELRHWPSFFIHVVCYFKYRPSYSLAFRQLLEQRHSEDVSLSMPSDHTIFQLWSL